MAVDPTGARTSESARGARARISGSRSPTQAAAPRTGHRTASGSRTPARAFSSSMATGAGWSCSPGRAAARSRWFSSRCARWRVAEKLRAAIVEDEPPARLGLRTLLAADAEVELVAECGSVEEALAALREGRVDLLFLDVQLARRTGFDLLAALGPARPPAVVFVTAYDQHAVRAFDVEAVDYLLKPFDDQRFTQALARAKDRVRQERAKSLAQELAETLAPGARGADAPRTLLLKDGARSMFLREDEIDWIEAQDYYVEIHAGAPPTCTGSRCAISR